MNKYQVRAIASETIETDWHTIEKGDEIIGYLNSYHRLGVMSVQVELTAESGGVAGCSGITVVDVPILDGLILGRGEK